MEKWPNLCRARAKQTADVMRQSKPSFITASIASGTAFASACEIQPECRCTSILLACRQPPRPAIDSENVSRSSGMYKVIQVVCFCSSLIAMPRVCCSYEPICLSLSRMLPMFFATAFSRICRHYDATTPITARSPLHSDQLYRALEALVRHPSFPPNGQFVYQTHRVQ